MNIQFNHSGGSSRLISLVLLCLLLFVAIGTVYGAAPAGAIIKNQASASYRDTQGVRRIATSNVVETVIQQVAAIELSLSQTKPGAAGQETGFTHTLVNTGNGTDSFDLRWQSLGGDFSLTDFLIYADTDRDGQVDSYEPVTESPALRAGESWSFIVAGVIPFDAQDSDSAAGVVSTTSVFDSSINDSNTDMVTVTDSAVVEIYTQIIASSGAAPEGPFTVRVEYKNTGQVLATDVTILDALPQGLSYVAGSGRWSGTGAIPLTDNNANDSQSGIRYCAYDASCTDLQDANANSDGESANQVTGIVAQVEAGGSGYLEFDVSIQAGLSAGVLFNTAELHYSAGAVQIGLINSNTVPLTVPASASVVINGSTESHVDGTQEPLLKQESVFGAGSHLPVCQSQASDPDSDGYAEDGGDGYAEENSAECIVQDLQSGNSLFYKNTVWNLGNSTDAFDITSVQSSFPVGTLFVLLKADSQTPLLDTNNNGIPDTGLITVGESQGIVLQVVLPASVSGNNGDIPFSVTTVATSTTDASVANSMLNMLQNITPGSVDITHTTSIANATETTPAPGMGAGPEPEAVIVVQVRPGAIFDFDLVINNTGDQPMEFTLAASIHSDFSSIELPPQWLMQFLSEYGEVITSTGVIPAGRHENVAARIVLPDEIPPSLTSIYFRALNHTHHVMDIKHNAVSVEADQSLLLGINQEGNSPPGGSYVYSHTLANTGNTEINNISLTLSDSLASDGFRSVVYEDTDSNGVLGSDDKIIDTISLAGAESTTLFIKIFVPASASHGMLNFTELVVSTGVEQQVLNNVTNVSAATISVLKEQALDELCDGTLDSSYSSSVFSVEPGNNCIRYRLTASNAGTDTVLNVVVADATPGFTSYTGSAVCSQIDCTVTEPDSGRDGDIKASLPVLLPGDSVVVEFSVRID